MVFCLPPPRPVSTALDVRTGAIPILTRLIKEQNSPVSARKNRDVRHISNKSLCCERILQFKVRGGKRGLVVGHRNDWNPPQNIDKSYCTSCHLSVWVCRLFAVHRELKTTAGEVKLLYSCFLLVGAGGGVKVWDGHWLYWLFIINTA